MSNKLIIAAAGSGKTTYLVQEALKIPTGKVLITTFTESNEQEIKTKFIEMVGFIPPNVTILTWFSFLIRQGVKPYQSFLFQGKVTGLKLVNEKSGLLRYYKGKPIYAKAEDVAMHYFTKDGRIYSDKLAKFVCKLDEVSGGLTINRISRIYKYIFVDEVQDLAGYDLEIIQLLSQQGVKLLMVGDPRQVTYHTHEEAKNSQYSEGGITRFISDRHLEIDIDQTTLNVTYRNEQHICNYANSIYPDFSPCTAVEKEPTGHDGMFFVRTSDLEAYLRTYQPVQLRDSRRTTVSGNYPVFNFGDSKGLTFNRVIIYPTEPITKWICNHNIALQPKSQAKFYVAVTRARFSAGIVIKDKQKGLPELQSGHNELNHHAYVISRSLI